MSATQEQRQAAIKHAAALVRRLGLRATPASKVKAQS